MTVGHTISTTDPADEIFAAPKAETEFMPDGGLILRSAIPLGCFEASAGEWLRDRAAATPDRVFLAERNDAGDWVTLTYGEASRVAHAVGQALLDRMLSPTRPVVALSGNSIDHAILMLGCYLIGIPFCPVSVAYSLVCTDPGNVQAILDTVPGPVFAQDGDAFHRTLTCTDLHGAEVVVSRGGQDGWTRLDSLVRTEPGPAVDRAFAAVGPDTIAKVLFTSGSTGRPKGVPNTHRMISSNQRALELIWPFTNHEPPILVDWLPWSHTFGGNHNLHLVLRSGGTLFIDAGKPTPELFETSVRNLVDVSPTIYLNVPLGFAMLVDRLEADPDAARAFFRRLRLILYAAAALPQDTWDRLTELARRFAPHEVALTTSWGATETAPAATSAHFLSTGRALSAFRSPGPRSSLLRSTGAASCGFAALMSHRDTSLDRP
jgi:feruloyl-CoA synthase